MNDAGSVIVGNKRITLKKFNGSDSLNIYPQVRAFNIYESLDNACVVGNFIIADGIDLINNYPLGGEERIEVEIQTPQGKVISYNFVIESIKNMTVNDQGNLRTYALNCVTEDFLKNTSTVYSKRYYKMDYLSALETVMQDWGASVSLVTKEKTKGKFDFIVNQKRPLQIIDIIKERAVSEDDNLSSSFVFYQDNEGYHFQTYEKLIKDRLEESSRKVFNFDVTNRFEDIEKVINVRNILHYEVLHQGNQIEKIRRGGIRNQFRQFDISRGTYYDVKEYINDSDHKNFESTGGNYDFNSHDFNVFNSSMPALTKMTVKDGLRPEMEHNLNLHYQRPFMERLSQSSLRIRTYGDTDIRVGDVIRLKFPEISGLTREPKEAEITTGNYIITTLRHMCTVDESNEFDHFLIMECKKTQQPGRALG